MTIRRQLGGSLVLIALAGVASADGGGASTPNLNLESFDVVWTTIRDHHPDPALRGLDWETVRAELRPRVAAARSTEEAREVMVEMIDRLDQSHFQIIPAEVLEALGRRPEEGALGGETGVDVRVIGGRALVTAVRAASSAAVAGVAPGWEVTDIDGEDLAPVLRKVADAYRGRSWLDAHLAGTVDGRLEGPVGTEVRVGMRGGGRDRTEVVLKRQEPRGERYKLGFIPGIPVWIEHRTLAGGVGYVAFSSFLDPVRLMPELGKAITSFMTAPGVILDLRGNGGGLGAMVTGVAGWLVGPGQTNLGTVRLRDVELRMVVFRRPETYSGPVAILTDGLSVSGAEVLAGGLQALGRARVFGSRTAGMVLASQIDRLPNGDAFQYVFANYTSPSGAVLEGRGVVPDVEISPGQEDLLASRDQVLEAAVGWIVESSGRADQHARDGSKEPVRDAEGSRQQ